MISSASVNTAVILMSVVLSAIILAEIFVSLGRIYDHNLKLYLAQNGVGIPFFPAVPFVLACSIPTELAAEDASEKTAGTICWDGKYDNAYWTPSPYSTMEFGTFLPDPDAKPVSQDDAEVCSES